MSGTWFLCLAGLLAAGAAAVQAQTSIPPYPEFRADVISGRGTSALVGAGAVLPVGVYVRIGLDATTGMVWGRDGVGARADGRIDAIARFLLDPFREVPVGLSVGGGVSVPYLDSARPIRPYLSAVVDIEGRMRGRVSPAIEAGLGGGARIAAIIRLSAPRWR